MSHESSEPPIALLDLDPDLLLLVVEACGAQGQAVCKAACKLLALLVEEVEKTTPFFTTAAVDRMDSGDPAATVMGRIDADLLAAPTMGMLLSTSRRLASEAALRSLAKRLPKPVELAGAVCAEVVDTKGGEVRSIDDAESFTLALGRFPEAEVRSFLLTEMPAQLSDAATNGAAEEGWKVFVLYPCGRGTRFAEALVDTLQRAHPDGAPGANGLDTHTPRSPCPAGQRPRLGLTRVCFAPRAAGQPPSSVAS